MGPADDEGMHVLKLRGASGAAIGSPDYAVVRARGACRVATGLPLIIARPRSLKVLL